MEMADVVHKCDCDKGAHVYIPIPYNYMLN